MRKRCRKCGKAKDRSRFYRNARVKDGLQSYCKDCSKAVVKAHLRMSPVHETKDRKIRMLTTQLQRRVRDTQACGKPNTYMPCTTAPEAIAYAFIQQDGRCAICGKDCKLFADHDHKTGEFRAGLCGKCNAGLGFFNDSVNMLIQAARYLHRFET